MSSIICNRTGVIEILDQKPDGNLVATCPVIGGPNGSGKSTIFELLNPKGEFVNADVIARLIDPHAPQSVDLSAAKATLERVQELLNEGRDFVFETTLSGHQTHSSDGTRKKGRLSGGAGFRRVGGCRFECEASR